MYTLSRYMAIRQDALRLSAYFLAVELNRPPTECRVCNLVSKSMGNLSLLLGVAYFRLYSDDDFIESLLRSLPHMRHIRRRLSDKDGTKPQ